MSRLRQINSQNYFQSETINAEFENIVRYLNASEYGNKTLAELLDMLFDDEGNLTDVLQIRFDPVLGLQFRFGEHLDREEGWIDIAPPEALRGMSGADVGIIGDPVFSTRYDYTALGGETEMDVEHDSLARFMVFLNGLLLSEARGDYRADENGGTNGTGSIVFAAPLQTGDRLSVFKLVTEPEYEFRRADFELNLLQSSVPFVHEQDDPLLVYKNGVLLAEGADKDYVRQPDNDVITFTAPLIPGTRVSVVLVKPYPDVVLVEGVMLESRYADANGYIRYDRVAVPDGAIIQTKVDGLVEALANVADITISAMTPVPATRLWLDTSVTPNQLKFYDGIRYLSTNPASAIPDFDDQNTMQYLRVDGTGLKLEWGDISFSALIPKTQKGAANGVATLDAGARLPPTQLPEVIASDSVDLYVSGGVADNTYRIKRFAGQRLRIIGFEARLDSGNCDTQLELNGVVIGGKHTLGVTTVKETLSPPLEIDATVNSQQLSVIVTNGASPTNLDVALSLHVLS